MGFHQALPPPTRGIEDRLALGDGRGMKLRLPPPKAPTRPCFDGVVEAKFPDVTSSSSTGSARCPTLLPSSRSAAAAAAAALALPLPPRVLPDRRMREPGAASRDPPKSGAFRGMPDALRCCNPFTAEASAAAAAAAVASAELIAVAAAALAAAPRARRASKLADEESLPPPIVARFSLRCDHPVLLLAPLVPAALGDEEGERLLRCVKATVSPLPLTALGTPSWSSPPATPLSALSLPCTTVPLPQLSPRATPDIVARRRSELDGGELECVGGGAGGSFRKLARREDTEGADPNACRLRPPRGEREPAMVELETVASPVRPPRTPP